MELHEVHEKIVETHEGGHHGGHAESHPMSDEKFRKRVAILVGAFAVLAALCGLGGREGMKEMINANIQASDAYAYYQAKNLRQSILNTSADALEIEGQSALAGSDPAPFKAKVEALRGMAAQLDSDPQGGNGKKELLAKARGFETVREEAQRRGANFEYAEALVEIAVVLASTSIVAASRSLLAMAIALAGLGGLIAVNGLLNVVPL